MPVLSAIFLTVALVLAVVIGPQLQAWTWGPSMLALGLAVAAALPAFWQRVKQVPGWPSLSLACLTAAWFAGRAWLSPVAGLGQADLFLLAGALGSFVCVGAIAGDPPAEKVLTWGVALLLLANLLVIGNQLADPSFTPVFGSRAAERMISGFFVHYNDAANYLIVSAMWLAAAALFGRHATATRWFWGVLAAAALASVWLTHSRGGILGAAVALGILAALALVVAKRRASRWFAPALIAIPILGVGVAAFLWLGWQNAQQQRFGTSAIASVLDNGCRLYFLGIALSCIQLHPLIGGGSRSFSWECFGFADAKAHGDILTRKPEFVHNEWLQSATDYGLVGTALLAALLVTLVVAALMRCFFTRSADGTGDAWRLGALAALAGMLVQAAFSFVFHLWPGALLLGICLGQLSRPTTPAAPRQPLVNRALLSLAAIACALLLVPAGWTATRITRILWPTYLGTQAPPSPEAKIDALGEALALWPQAPLYQDRAQLFQSLAGSPRDPQFHDFAQRAVADYQNASRLHPYDPQPVINRANLLSLLECDPQAEALFAQAIAMQGGMEPGFRAHFSLATHYLRKALRPSAATQPATTRIATLELAAQSMATATAQMHWSTPDLLEPAIAIHEYLGAAHETAGDLTAALNEYNIAAAIPTGARNHYQAGRILAKIALAAWYQRQPETALTRFLEARRRIIQIGNQLPAGVTPSQRLETIAYLDHMIALLKRARIKPTGP